jgi:hypothetical protein
MDFYDGEVAGEEVAAYAASAEASAAPTNEVGFGRRRRITAEERDELKRKCDEMADECVARNKRGVACEDERKRCKRRVYPRWFNATTFHDRLGHFLYTPAERAERAGKAGRAERAGKEERAEKRALGEMKRFLAEHGASLATVDGKLLNVLERGYMDQVRARVPYARLIGIPANLDDTHWREYARLYCAYLVAVGNLHAPATIFVSVPGTKTLRVCLLRVDSDGHLGLLY